ncbi:hypothetical protein [Streptomyces sp. AN091965]|uniref:hypothetical protein n=1 Tax=Streptomyces sp. AN091965 TaxID=2927803 RepID=UPI001F61532A|nr:hypothetical protein [Streptomyces sp. AN091965]MCI3928593.1 hypothetical protein [Streptomyces sp. AN091965]
MGKLIHLVHQSLDGRMEDPDGAFDWPALKESGTDLVLFGGTGLAAHLTEHRTELDPVESRTSDGRSTLLRYRLAASAAKA